MSSVSPATAPEDLPAGAAVSDIYEQVVAIAEDELDGSLSSRIRTWEDGDIEVRVWHKYGLPGESGHLKGVIRYHSRTGLSAAIVEVDGEEEWIRERIDLDRDGVGLDATDREKPAKPA